MNNLPFTRRDFLKLSGAGLLGAFLADLRLDHAFASSTATQGRMVQSGIYLYSDPNFKSKTSHIFGRDEVVSITSEVDGDLGNPFNKKWYQVNGEGYVYSGFIQPVETNYQRPSFQIPAAGQLGEVTVPFSDTHRSPNYWADRGYRIYYGTTHWVKSVSVNRYEKAVWYEIYDSEIKDSFYVAATDMRLIPPDELTLLSPDIPESRKHIYVDLATQSVTAFEDDKAVLTARCSSGGAGTKTPVGDFQTFHKGPTIHMTNDGEVGAGHGYDLPGVPWVSFFTSTGVSFHGTYWHNDYGEPRSHGCVNLFPADSKFIYRWTRPEVPTDTPYLYKPGEGTRVQIISSNS